MQDATLFQPSPAKSFAERRPLDWANLNAPLLVATIAGQRMHLSIMKTLFYGILTDTWKQVHQPNIHGNYMLCQSM